MKKILIASNCQKKTKILKEYMKNIPCKVDEVLDGEEAFSYCLQKTPDIIFLKAEMPNLSGIEFLRLFQDTLGKEKKMPSIVFCVDEGDTTQTSEALKLGALAYIEAPYTAEQFQKSLNKLGMTIPN